MSENSIYTEQVECPYCHEVVKAPNQPSMRFFCSSCGKELVTFDKKEENHKFIKDVSTEYEEEPPEINEWNWGAFTLTWIWSIANGIYWPLVLIAIGFLSVIADSEFMNILAGIAGLVISIILGVNGNRWAWEEKYWESADAFCRTQYKWNLAGLYIFIIGCIFVAAIAVLSPDSLH